MDRLALKDSGRQGCDAPCDRRTYEDVANTRDYLSNAEESVVEGKDATLDADDDRWVKHFSGVYGLGRGC